MPILSTPTTLFPAPTTTTRGLPSVPPIPSPAPGTTYRILLYLLPISYGRMLTLRTVALAIVTVAAQLLVMLLVWRAYPTITGVLNPLELTSLPIRWQLWLQWCTKLIRMRRPLFVTLVLMTLPLLVVAPVSGPLENIGPLVPTVVRIGFPRNRFGAAIIIVPMLGLPTVLPKLAQIPALVLVTLVFPPVFLLNMLYIVMTCVPWTWPRTCLTRLWLTTL